MITFRTLIDTVPLQLSATIGLFPGMFERNMLTFSLGWTDQAESLNEFADVRKIQQSLKAKGLTLASDADESSTGRPA